MVKCDICGRTIRHDEFWNHTQDHDWCGTCDLGYRKEVIEPADAFGRAERHRKFLELETAFFLKKGQHENGKDKIID